MYRHREFDRDEARGKLSLDDCGGHGDLAIVEMVVTLCVVSEGGALRS